VAEFVDTNVLLYAYDASAGARHVAARDIVLRLAREHAAAVSVQVLQEFYVNAVSKIAVPLSPVDARRRLRAFSRWRVHSPIPDDVLAATIIAEDQQLSFWDSMILQSASRLGCTLLWSEDLNAGQVVAGVEIRSPFA
jgi:predicted nucleic acid-binding protein